MTDRVDEVDVDAPDGEDRPGADDAVHAPAAEGVEHRSDGRVTEVGAPELIDRADHSRATIVGAVVLVLAIVVTAVGLGSLIAGDDDGPQVAEVVLPRLGARTMVQAQQELERLGLLVDIRFEPNEIVPADVVVGQEPIAGARLEVGEQVVLVVSDGPVGITVPDLAGAQVAEARRALAVLGLQLAVREAYDEEVAMGEIIRSEPRAGGRAQLSGTVTVIVSRGPEPRTVPDVVGRTEQEAFAAIGRADLQIGRVTERRVDADRAGTVLSVEPEPGSKVPRDQPVRVVVGTESGPLEVPDVVGLTRATATSTLSGHGLRVGVRTEAVPAGDRRAGRVISQSPIAGAEAGSGDSVTIVVGEVAAPAPPAPPGGAPTTTAAPP